MKQYTSGSSGKLIYSITQFNKGMYYSNSPLPHGYVKSLTNMDISANGDFIRPRQALVTSSLTSNPYAQMIPYLSRQDSRYVYYFGIPDTVNESDYINDVLPESLIDNTQAFHYMRSHYHDETQQPIEGWQPIDLSYVTISLPKRNIKRVVEVKQGSKMGFYCVDGDTLDVRLEGSTEFIRCRLIGVDAPEWHSYPEERGSTAAAHYLSNRVNPTNTQIYVEFDDYLGGEDAKDAYGRTLVYLWSEGSLVNAELLHLGLARMDVLYANRFIKYFNLFTHHHNDAIEKKRGIYQTDSPVFTPPITLLNEPIRIEVLSQPPVEYVELEYKDGIAFLGRIININTRQVAYKGLLLLNLREGIPQLEQLVPYNPIVNEALNVGFNLLLDNPYNFNNYFGYDAIGNGINYPDVLGVLAYEKGSNRIVQHTTSLKNVDIKALVATPPLSPSYSGYAVRWEYRSSNENEFTVLQDWTLAFDREGNPIGENALLMPEFDSAGAVIDVRFSLAQAMAEAAAPSEYVYDPDVFKYFAGSTKPTMETFLTPAQTYLVENGLTSYSTNNAILFHYFDSDLDQYGESVVVLFPHKDDLDQFRFIEREGQLYIENTKDTTVRFFGIRVFRYTYNQTEPSITSVEPMNTHRDGFNNGYLYIPANREQPISHLGKVVGLHNLSIINLNPDLEDAINPYSIRFGLLTGFQVKAGFTKVIEPLSHILDIRKATRIAQFYRQIILYGGNIGDNILQFSSFEDPSYFPYPYGSITLPEPIVHVHIHNDQIVVFGRENIYMLYDGQEPINLRLSKIYSNLSITSKETATVRSVGRSVFFISNNKGYLIQPNIYTSKANEVRVVSITEPIERLMEDPKEYIMQRLLIGYQQPLDLSENYLIEESKKISYIYNDTIYIFTLYQLANTNYRLLVIYLYDLTNRRWRLYDSITVTDISYIHFFSQLQITGQSTISYFKTSDVERINVALDTGYMTIDPNHHKRFRTIIFRVNNSDGSDIPAMIEFKIDGIPRQMSREYRIILDDNGELTPIPQYTENIKIGSHMINKFSIPGTTILNYMALNYARFPSIENLELRFNVSGRGKAPSFLFVASTIHRFEITSYGIIYKKKSV